jgi:hypothetical protein
MNRPVAAKQPAVAAVNAPHDKPNQPRRDISGDVSSGVFAFGFAVRVFPAAALVVLPANPALGGAGAAFPVPELEAPAGFGSSAIPSSSSFL